ncbi:NADPH-dependent FMN reductase [Ensifer canadensis]
MAGIVGISGNLSRPSKTRTLVNLIVGEVASTAGADHRCFDLLDAFPAVGTILSRKDAAAELNEIFTAIETCDVLVVGSPTFKASYTGLLKHLFDLLDMKALQSRTVLLCASGKATPHGPKVEQHFRMLFDFFGARVAPKFIFALDEDFTPEGLPTDDLRERVAQQVLEARRLELI